MTIKKRDLWRRIAALEMRADELESIIVVLQQVIDQQSPKEQAATLARLNTEMTDHLQLHVAQSLPREPNIAGIQL